MTALPVENVQDYPRPPALEPVADRLRVEFGGVTIADTTRGYRVLETHHAPTYYIPPEDVLMSALVPTARETHCEWKGRAAYFDIVLDTRRSPQCGLGLSRARRALWRAEGSPVVLCRLRRCGLVGDLRVTPQPGDFYGGWVTPNLTGRIKGAAGTMHW
jgi:uncharacterized protein (DUF427 family)